MRPQAYRHRWEMPLVRVAVVLSVLAVVVSVVAAVVQQREELASYREAFEDVGAWGWLVLFGPLLVFFQRLYMAAGLRANSARVGPTQFPALWQMYTELATRMDVSPVPALYVSNGNGAVNAYALSCNSRWKYVSINAELAHHIRDQPQVVEFVLAHELAHHKLGHVSLLRITLGLVMNLLVVPGKSLIRAQEYSADRLAAAYCPQAVHGLVSLSVGPWLAHDINAEAFYEQAKDDDASWMIRMTNVMSDHAVMTKRYKALRELGEHGFERHGQMF